MDTESAAVTEITDESSYDRLLSIAHVVRELPGRGREVIIGADKSIAYHVVISPGVGVVDTLRFFCYGYASRGVRLAERRERYIRLERFVYINK